MKAVQAIVHGRVQGVGFRYHTQRQAQGLGVVGYVRNLPDGTVEIVVEGEPGAVAALMDWAQRGPAAAQVAQVTVRDRTPQGAFREFAIAR